jgi:glycosyltransferase involved in cell wall biosynthesis
MKILGIMNGMSGVSYHRLYAPLHDLQTRGFAEVDIWTPRDENGQYRPLPPLNYDLVIWNGTLTEPQEQIISIMNNAGIPFIVDIDDYWMINRYNPAVYEWRARGISAKIQAAMFHADAVICENDRLREQVFKVNKNVCTIGNALNLTELQWNQEKRPADKFRVGYIGSRSHRYDLLQIAAPVREFCEATGSEFNLCGYDPADPEWTAVGHALAPVGHPDWLKFRPGVHPSQYGGYYAGMDVVLAPLIGSTFNNCKSDIKVKEAGAYSLPVIASDFGPYKDHDSAGVFTCYGHKGWLERLYEAYEGKLSGAANAAYLNDTGDLHRVNLERVEFLNKVLVNM